MDDSDLPLGPVDEPLVIDDFTYEEVKTKKCFASVCDNICDSLMAAAADNADTKYLCICVPCYNENLEELIKTFLSLMENIDFMQRKARFHGDDSGRQLKKDFQNTIPVIVPIFDGTKALSPSIREWISANFKGVLDGMDGPSGPGLVDVRVASSKWWYYCDDTLTDHDEKGEGVMSQRRTNSLNPALTNVADDAFLSNLMINRSKKLSSDNGSLRQSLTRPMSQNSHFSEQFNMGDVIYFHVVPIVKRSNHRKHNSHEWFFNSICQGLGTRAKVAFLTDCGTTYNATCLARLFYELYFKKDLIGVTARQRVETPNAFFHPCEDSPFSCLEGDHTASGDRTPCWKCWAVYFLSPCPLQGFEFEATLIMNSAMFNLVEALPVMPGPCQLLDWQKMKKHRVVDEYFNLLFKGESDNTIPRLPSRLRVMAGGSIRLNNVKRNSRGAANSSPTSINATAADGTTTVVTDGSSDVVVESGNSSGVERPKSSPVPVADGKSGILSSPLSPSTVVTEDPTSITFTEFLRVNMRLAEDRILSFVCVFSTGYGTKWIPGATFFYQPEIKWQTLLTQRRRWLNGTFASFLFFFNSKRAKSRITGGMFDSHKAGKNIRLVNALWSLQLFQLLLVLMSPAVFGSASYIGLKDSAKIWPDCFSWANETLFGTVTGADLWLFFYLSVYALWTLYSYFEGKMPELLCRTLAVLGFFFVFPIYFAVWATIFTKGLDFVDGLVVASLGLPVVIALAQSATSALLYVLYLPWFLFLILFFLVYIPSYSFARLWDTTWGNRAGGADSAISDKITLFMKKYNFIFIVCLVTFNIFLAWSLIRLFRFGYSIVLGFMFIVFCPMIIQLVCSFLFLFIVVPLRNLTERIGSHDDHHSNNRQDSDCSDESTLSVSALNNKNKDNRDKYDHRTSSTGGEISTVVSPVHTKQSVELAQPMIATSSPKPRMGVKFFSSKV